MSGVRKARTLLWVYYAYMVEYRAELILWVLSGSLPLILMGVWIEAAQGGQFGLQPVEFARYFLAAFIARQFTVVWVVWEFEKEVVEGRLSPRLLQPMDPVWHHVASHISERLARLPFMVFLVLLFFALYPQAFWVPSLGQGLLFLVAIALAFVLRFLIQYTFALVAFWTERASAIEQFWMLFFLFLSGLIAPGGVPAPGARSCPLDPLSLPGLFSSGDFGRAACKYPPRTVSNAGLVWPVFWLESLAVATGVKTVFGNGSLKYCREGQGYWDRTQRK